MKNKLIQILQIFICFIALTVVLNAQCDVLSINSVLLDPDDPAGFNFDADGNGTVSSIDEFVEICNLSGATIDLSTVTIVDAAGNTRSLSGFLAAGACVFAVSNWDTAVNAVPSNVINLDAGAYINNEGDLLQLVQGGVIICEVGAGGFACFGATADCIDFPEDTDGCVNSLAEAAFDCGGTLVPVSCPDLSDLVAGTLEVEVTESVCEADGMTLSGGMIAAPITACPAGSSIEYSLDEFATAGTAMVPTYDQIISITVSTRCVCESDDSNISAVTNVTTDPGTCSMNCPDLSVLAAGTLDIVVTESMCEADGVTLSGGVTSAPATACPAGSELEFSLDGFATAGSPTLPAYNQTTAITVSSRCVCESDPTIVSEVSIVTTMPGVCAPPPSCSIENISTMSTCNEEGIFSLEVCYDHTNPLTADGLVDITVDGISFPNQMPTAGCVTLNNADFVGDGSAGLSVMVGDSGGLVVDCATAATPIVYIAESNNGSGIADECAEGGEYVTICATEGCHGCPEIATDLTGWEIEDAATNDGSPETSINILSGSLMPGECLQVFSFILTSDDNSIITGTEGSSFEVFSDRQSGSADCKIWNNTIDDIYLYDGDSQGVGILVDQEGYDESGDVTYEAPALTGCGAGAASSCQAESTFDAPNCCQLPEATVFSTCSDGNDAQEGFYYVEITITDLGTDTDGNNDVLVSVNGGTTVAFSATGTYYLGPIAHSGSGMSPAAISVQNSGESCALDLVASEVICGFSTSGAMTSDGTADTALNASGPACDCDAFTPGFLLAQVAPGSFDASSSVMVYILVDAMDNVVTNNHTGLFTGLSNQSYEIYPYNVAIADLDDFLAAIPARGSSFSTFMEPDGCSAGCGSTTFSLDCNCTIDCGTLACNDAINITVNSECEVTGIGLDNLLEGPFGDPDNYQILITASDGSVVDHRVETTTTTDDIFNYVGQQLTYKVSCETNSCWGLVTLEDKTPPTLNCDCPEGGEDLDGDGTVDGYAPECILSCYDVTLLEGEDNLPSDIAEFVASSIEDNCRNYTVRNIYFEDDITDGSMCTASILQRTWFVEFEAARNGPSELVSCVREYMFQPITVVDTEVAEDTLANTLYRPVLTVAVNCLSEIVTPEEVANQLGDEFGYPHIFVNDKAVGVTSDGLCNIMVTYKDTNTGSCAPECNGNSKIVRRWTVLNWCNTSITEYHQVINLVDEQGPILIVGEDIDTTTAPNKCRIDVGLPHPELLADFCGGETTFFVSGTSHNNTIIGNMTNGYAAMDLPAGDTDIYYVGEDCCGNQSFDTITITIKDLVHPNAIAEEFIVVPMTISPEGEAWARVLATSVDNGSFDACSDVTLEIRREDNHCDSTDVQFGPSVSFCCEDMEASGFGEVLVELKVTDACGNFSIVTSKIILQDNTMDVLTCPVGMVVGCQDDIDDFSVTGMPSQAGLCGAAALSLDTLQILSDTRPRAKSASADPKYDVDGDGTPDMIPAFDPDCGYGAIRRQFEDEGVVICTQFFVVVPDAFDPSTIVWPQDQTVGCSSFVSVEPTFDRTVCSSFGVSVESDTLATTDGSCFKIVNTWNVIDWCKFGMTNGAEGVYSSKQELNIVDGSDPVIEIVGSSDFDLTSGDCMLYNLSLSAVATDADMCPTELLEWVIEVDFYDDGSVDLTRSSTSFPADTLNLLLSSVPASKQGHAVTWSATDGCGNVGSQRSIFRVNDVLAPRPYCLNLSTSVGDTGSFELWAIDFDGAASDNCTAQEALRFTFSDVEPPVTFGYYDPVDGSPATLTEFLAGTADRWDPVFNSAGRRFTSFDLDSLSRLTLSIYIWDECGNKDFCVVTPLITDPNGPSGGGSISIQGKFRTERGHAIQDVAAEVMTDLPEYPSMVMTYADGEYAFMDNPMNRTYSITGYKNHDHLNGISTLDLIILQQHILGSRKLATPYELIAADINNDKAVNGVDVIELRKLILGIYSELPENTSWKFMDGSEVLTMVEPWIYREQIEMNSLTTDRAEENFIGVKIGDLDGDVIPNAFNQATELRSNALLTFKYENAFVRGGEVFLMELNTDHPDLYGYQFSLDMDRVDLIDIEGVDLTEQNYNVTETQLVISQNSHSAIDIKDGVLRLRLRAKREGWIDDLVRMNSSMARAEAYVTSAYEVMDLELYPYDGFELKQNVPNPFADYTTIEYKLPQSGMVTLTLFDIAGRQLKVIESYGQRGLNSMEISKATIGRSGVIYYKLDYAERTAMKRMMILD